MPRIAMKPLVALVSIFAAIVAFLCVLPSVSPYFLFPHRIDCSISRDDEWRTYMFCIRHDTFSSNTKFVRLTELATRFDWLNQKASWAELVDESVRRNAWTPEVWQSVRCGPDYSRIEMFSIAHSWIVIFFILSILIAIVAGNLLWIYVGSAYICLRSLWEAGANITPRPELQETEPLEELADYSEDTKNATAIADSHDNSDTNGDTDRISVSNYSKSVSDTGTGSPTVEDESAYPLLRLRSYSPVPPSPSFAPINVESDEDECLPADDGIVEPATLTSSYSSNSDAEDESIPTRIAFRPSNEFRAIRNLVGDLKHDDMSGDYGVPGSFDE